MSALENLPTVELQRLARGWREQALRGVTEARGFAHEHEAELRRRLGRSTGLATSADLDLRPLDQRMDEDARRPWWRFW